MDQQSTTISELAGVEADLVYLAPMTERPHSYTYDPPPGVPRLNTVNTPLPRESIELRTIAFHSA